MAGGEGSRLRPLTSRRPKPLVPVVGLPVMEHILDLLRRHGITEVVVTLAYLGADIRNHFGDGGDFGMSIEYVVEDSPLGTAGSVRNAAHLLDDTFVVISGDALTDFDLTWAVQEHRRRGSHATIVLYSVPNPLEYGVVVTDQDGAVRRFLEKPSWGEVFSDQANTGIYVIEPQVLDYVKPGISFDWSQDVFPQMLRRHDPLYGIVAAGYWCDIGNIQSYLQANWDALEGRVNCRIPGTRNEAGVWVGEGVEFGLHVRIEGPAFIGDEAKIKAGAFLNGPVVIDKYCVVDDNAKVSNSVIWPHSYVGENSRLRQSLLCRSVTVKNNVLLEENTVVGDDCVIGAGSRVAADVKIWPHKEVQAGSTVHESIIWAGEWKRGLFASYGLSGLINVELTPEFCSRLGAAYAATLPKGATIAVTRDRSRSSRMIKRALIAGIVSAGGNVRDLSELPVPVTQFGVAAQGCSAGVHVLTSPLDQRSADIRFYDATGVQIDKRAERKLENLFFREDIRRAAFYEMGEIDYADPMPDYVRRVLESVDVEAVRGAQLRLLLEYDYSAASMALPEILNELDVTGVPLHSGFGEQYRPKPPDQFRAALEEAALIARTIRANVGMHLNPSGERVRLIDDIGRILDVHQTLGVLVVLTLQHRKGTVVTPATAPHWITRVIEENGGTHVSAKGDPAALIRSALQVDAVLAADDDGGVCWPEHMGAFDGMFTLAKLLELLARSGRRLSEVCSELPGGAYLTRTEFCPWEAKGRVMRVLLEQHNDALLDLADGIKVFVEGGWVLVQPDPDTPYYHIVVSVEDMEKGRALLADYAERVRAAQEVGGVRMATSSVVDLPALSD
jgi:mannose-1-phosphate guanylyltransferase / phosphomannomutase